MSLSPEKLRSYAVARVLHALTLIEQAQGDLAQACAELSALEGGCPVWRETSKQHDRVKALWYRVERFRLGGRFRLDRTNIAALEREAAASADVSR